MVTGQISQSLEFYVIKSHNNTITITSTTVEEC